MLRRLDFAAVDWHRSLLDALTTCRRDEGGSAALEAIVTEIVNPTAADMSRGLDDPVPSFASILLVLSIQVPTGLSLVHLLVGDYLPTLLDGHASPYALNSMGPLARTVRLCLLLLHEARPEVATTLVGPLVDELQYQRARPGPPPPRETNGSIKRPGTAKHTGSRAISQEAKMAVDLLVKALDDDALRNIWPALSRL